MKYKWTLLIILVFGILGFLFHESLLTSAAKYSTEWTFRSKFQSNFDYGEIAANSHSLVIKNPKISNRDGNQSASATKITIDYTIHWLSRILNLNIHIENPQVDLIKEPIDWLALVPTGAGTLYKIHGNVMIDNGLLSLHSNEEDFAETRSYALKGECKWGKGLQSQLMICGQGDHNNNNTLFLVCSKSPTGIVNFQWNAKQLNCTSFSDLIQTIAPGITPWKASKGILDGAMTLSHSAFTPLYAEGEFNVKDLELEHPDLEITATLGEGNLKLLPGSGQMTSTDLRQEIFPVWIGEAQLLSGCSMIFKEDGYPFCTVNLEQGNIKLTQESKAIFSLEGIADNENERSKFTFQGSLVYPDRKKASADFTLSVDHSVNSQTLIHSQIENWGLPQYTAKIESKNLSPAEFSFLQNFLGRYAPEWDVVQVYQGSFDAILKMEILASGIGKIDLEKLEARDVQCDFPDYKLLVGAKNVTGQGSINTAFHSPYDTLQGDFLVDDGEIELPGFDQSFLHFSDIQSQLRIKNGIIQASDASVELAGLKGTAHMDWFNPNEIMQITLNGRVQDLTPFVPEMAQKAIANQFKENTVNIQTHVKRLPQGARLEGQLTITTPSTNEFDVIYFGVDFDKKPSNFKETTADIYWESILPDFVKMVVPHITKPIGNLHAPWMNKGLHFGDLALLNGWFEASNLPLNKYVQPFLFTKHSFKLNGRSDCKGTFDLREIAIRYNGRSVYFELEPMTIEVAKVPSKEPKTPEEEFPAFHYFDLATSTNFGFIPIQNGTYFDKKTGLLFTDIDADLILDGEKFHVPNIQGYCCGINLAGQLDGDFTSPLVGVGEVDVVTHTLSGKVSNLQQIIAHFDSELPLLKVPLEANIALGQKGAGLHFSIDPDHDEITGHAQGTITDGEINYESGNAAIKDLSFNFEIDTIACLMNFTDFQGTVLLGSPKHVEEYVLNGKGIRFEDYSQRIGDFDLGISDKTQDLIRIAGTLEPQDEDGSLPSTMFRFDLKQTHFGDLYPHTIDLIMSDWSQIETMHLGIDFRLSSLLHDLQRYSRTGLVVLSRSLLEHLSDFSTVSGEIQLALDYDPVSSRFLFDASGKEVTVDAHHFKEVAFNGYKRDKLVAIEQLKLDDISIGAELAFEDAGLKANFLGIQAGDTLLAGLEGSFDEQNLLFDGKVNLLEIDLNHLSNWQPLVPFATEFAPSGKLKGTGKIQISKSKDKDHWDIDTLIDMNFNEVALKGLHLQDADHVSCHFISGQRLTFRQLKTSLFNPSNPENSLRLIIEKAGYNFGNEELELEGARFSIHAPNLPWAAEMLNKGFPDAIGTETRDLIASLKSSGTINGNFRLNIAPHQHRFRLSLEDSKYSIFSKEYDIRKFLLDKDTDELKIAAQVLLNEHLLWFTTHTQNPFFKKGQIILADALIDNSHEIKTPLKIEWVKSDYDEWIINEAEGTIAGMDFQLEHDPTQPSSTKQINLFGEIHIDGRKAQKIFSPGIAEALHNWQIGPGYSLKGAWTLGLDNTYPEDANVHFQGQIQGLGCHIKNYQFQNFSGNVYYSPGHLQLTNVLLSDPAGVVQIPKIDTRRNLQNIWMMNIPHIRISEFRPSMLTNVGKSTPIKSKSLVIQDISVENVNGRVGVPESFTGKGSLDFVNSSKGSLQNTIFAIPVEILSRIGLNTGIMTPVKGSIEFNLRNGQAQLTKFKDIYSDRKLSKFNLGKTSEPSYVDFDGNLFVQVHMKQYNLLFKLAELFTVSIKGTLQKPIYTLQKQQRFGKEKNIQSYEAQNDEND